AGTSFSDAIRACRADYEKHEGQHAADLAALQSELKLEEEKLARASGQLTELEPFRIAKQQSRWWTLIWWRATLRASWRMLWAEVNSSRESIQSAMAQVRTRIEDSETKHREQEDTLRRTLDLIVAAEVQRREEVIGRQQDEIMQTQTQLRRDWQ